MPSGPILILPSETEGELDEGSAIGEGGAGVTSLTTTGLATVTDSIFVDKGVDTGVEVGFKDVEVSIL